MSTSYNLEERTFEFSKTVLNLIDKLTFTTSNNILIKQVVRSATSIGANYIEANEAETPKEKKHRVYISRKEAKETSYWLELLKIQNKSFEKDIDEVQNECIQIRKILSAIYKNLH